MLTVAVVRRMLDLNRRDEPEEFNL